MLRRSARPAVAGGYLAGATAGAAVSAGLLLVLNGLLSPIPDTLTVAIAIVALFALTLRALGFARFPLPQRRYQIERSVFAAHPAKAAARFAFELGLGFRTYVTTSSPYAIVVVLVFVLPRHAGTALGASVLAAIGFGLGRSLVIIGQTLLRAPMSPSRQALKLADLVAVGAAILIAVRQLG